MSFSHFISLSNRIFTSFLLQSPLHAHSQSLHSFHSLLHSHLTSTSFSHFISVSNLRFRSFPLQSSRYTHSQSLHSSSSHLSFAHFSRSHSGVSTSVTHLFHLSYLKTFSTTSCIFILAINNHASHLFYVSVILKHHVQFPSILAINIHSSHLFSSQSS